MSDTRVFYIAATTEDGESADLMVEATDYNIAIDLYRREAAEMEWTFDLGDYGRCFCPSLKGENRVIPWHAVNGVVEVAFDLHNGIESMEMADHE